jgi:acetoin:2,6-dichlorophenolindophenol oxidoreductase subunit alpha
MDLGREKLLEMYQRMWEIRLFEDAVWKLCLENKIPGTTHLYQGQEAVAVGISAALDPDDYITFTYRSHGHILAKGADMKLTMAELLGRRTGLCGGKGGSMHLTDLGHGALGAFAIVGAGLPVAVGAGLSAQMRKTGQVAVACFGDGASNIGTFHESLNLAAIWKLPVVFVCENNLYGEYSPVSHTTAVPNIADRAVAYNMPGVIVDGNDILSVFEATSEAAEEARNGLGPSLLECKTYRQGGHSRNDTGKYRPIEEIDAWMRRDPIPLFSRYLCDKGLINEQEDQHIQSVASMRVGESVEFALESVHPELADAYTDVYSKER